MVKGGDIEGIKLMISQGRIISESIVILIVDHLSKGLDKERWMRLLHLHLHL
jgi:hypothetical protein